jgi:hypothetical protein
MLGKPFRGENSCPEGTLPLLRLQRALERPGAALLLAAFLSFSMWFYVDRVWAPPVYVYYSDLYPRWYGTRELLLRGRDPYGPEVTREMQAWGHPERLREQKLRDEPRFVYPLYIAFLLAPTVNYSFPTVEGIFRWVLPFTVLVSVPLWVTGIGWRCRWSTVGLLTLFSLGSFTTLQDIYLQQPVLLAGMFLATSAVALNSRHFYLAGVLLALATIKPQVSWLAVLWLLLWAFSREHSRRKFAWGFALAMAALVGASELLLPGWIREFASGLKVYSRATRNSWVLADVLTPVGAVVLAIGILIVSGVLLWRFRDESVGSTAFNFALCLVLVVMVAVAPVPYTTGQFVLLPSIFFLLKEHRKIWSLGRYPRLLYVAAFSLVGWQWVGSALFMAAAFFVPSTELRRFWIVPVGSLLLVPLAMLVLYLLLVSANLFGTSHGRPSIGCT